ncbi:MAG: MFS transporter [Actinobacteria bacterium]|nr:MFS transporter [Actinomycetota bacterium]
MVVAGLVSLFTDISSEMIVPVLPLFLANTLKVPTGAIGVIEGIAESTASILKVFSGWLSDRVSRRKPLMVAGYGFSNVIKPLFGFATSWGQVLVIRFADRFGKGVRGAPRDALIADSTTKENRGKAFGFHRAMDTIGAAIGPLSAFWIISRFEGNYRAVFFWTAVPGLIAVALLVLFLREKKPEGHSVRDLPRLGFRALDRRFMQFTLAATVFALGNSSDAFLILRAQDLGLSAALVPLAYFAFNATYSLFSMPLGTLSDRLGRRPVLVAGYLIFAVIYLGFALASRAAHAWALFVAYGLYYAATEGIQKAYIADLVAPGHRGTAIGTFNALTGLAALPASIIGGFLWQAFGPAATFLYGSMLAAVATAMLLVLRV